MSAEIKGQVRGPSGEIVPATVTLKPIPDPMRGSEGSVVTGGVVAASARGPISVLVDAGRYQVQVDTPSRTIANHPIALTDGQVVTLAEIVGLSPSVPPEPGSNSNTGAQVAPGGQGGASSLTKEQLDELNRKLDALKSGAMGSNEQTIDVSDTHTYTLAPAANVQTVILTKSKPGIVDLTHPANITWVPAPPELTNQVGSVVYLVFIKTGSGWQGYSAGDLDDINELLSTLPPMKSVIPKFIDNGWAYGGTQYLGLINTVTGSSADGFTIKVTHNVQSVLPNSKRGNSDFWNYVEEATETEKAKVKGGPLSQVGRTELKPGKPIVVEATIESDNPRTSFGLFGAPYNEKLVSIGANPNLIYEFSGNGPNGVGTNIKAQSGDSLRLKYDGTNCTAYLKPVGKETWVMLGTLQTSPFGHEEKTVYSRIDSQYNFTVKNWRATGEFA